MHKMMGIRACKYTTGDNGSLRAAPLRCVPGSSTYFLGPRTLPIKKCLNKWINAQKILAL